jgi:hypothetical protein
MDDLTSLETVRLVGQALEHYHRSIFERPTVDGGLDSLAQLECYQIVVATVLQYLHLQNQ